MVTDVMKCLIRQPHLSAWTLLPCDTTHIHTLNHSYFTSINYFTIWSSLSHITIFLNEFRVCWACNVACRRMINGSVSVCQFINTGAAVDACFEAERAIRINSRIIFSTDTSDLNIVQCYWMPAACHAPDLMDSPTVVVSFTEKVYREQLCGCYIGGLWLARNGRKKCRAANAVIMHM